jgi:hypothetical protein
VFFSFIVSFNGDRIEMLIIEKIAKINSFSTIHTVYPTNFQTSSSVLWGFVLLKLKFSVLCFADYCLSFCDWRILNTPLTSSNFSPFFLFFVFFDRLVWGRLLKDSFISNHTYIYYFILSINPVHIRLYWNNENVETCGRSVVFSESSGFLHQ